MTHLMPLVTNDAFAKFKDRLFQPVRDPALPPHANIFEVMRKQDILLHHPYESFDPVVELIEEAANDPQVLALKITLYRTSGDSPIVEALIDAANAGKQVTALVELRARFDEAANIQWARRLEESGAHVVYGVVGLKTHCKALLIVRRDTDRLRQYVHLGTGNYHHRTARIYTDFSLLTTNPKITDEVAIVFNTLTGLASYPGLEKLMVAPFDMSKRVIAMIERERDHALAGSAGRIIAKLNSPWSTRDHRKTLRSFLRRCENRSDCARHLLSAAEDAGLSENIRVISIVGRFLEHSRVYYFENNGQPDFIWPVPIGCRVISSGASKSLSRSKIQPCATKSSTKSCRAFVNDCVKARELQADGTYIRVRCEEGKPRKQAQLHFREGSRRQARELAESQRAPAVKLTPISTATRKERP